MRITGGTIWRLLALAAVAAIQGSTWAQVTQVQPIGAPSPSAPAISPAAATPAPDAERAAPNAEPAAPNAEPAAPNAEPAAPNAEPAAPNAEPAAPNAEPAAPNAEPQATPEVSGSASPEITGTGPAVTGTEAAASPTPVQLHYSIEIDLTHQRVYLLKDGKEFVVSPISSGRPDHLTPTGNFEVVQKDLNHFSTLYGKFVEKDSGRVVKTGADVSMPVPKGCVFQPAPMKWFMRFDGAAGMHAGVLPGYAASHGCVRMPAAKAELFFGLVDIGTPVHVFGTPPVHEVEEAHHVAAVVAKATAPASTPKAKRWWF